MVDLSIVIPTYNEAKRIGASLDELSKYLRSDEAKQYHTEVLVVDLDSPDGTADVVEKHKGDFEHLQVISAGPRPTGQFIKGAQVARGFEKAKGRYVMFMDADLATPLRHMAEVFQLMDENNPVGICVRDLSSSHQGIRKFVSNLGNWVAQVMVAPGIHDTQCGFKVFRADAAREIFSQQRIISWGFDLEALALARRYHYPITIFEVKDWHDVKTSSKLGGAKALKAAFSVLPDLIKIKWGLWTGKYRRPAATKEATA